MAVQTTDRLAVLIDADNAQAATAQELLTEISRYGTATVKRAYGDWTTTNLKGWKQHLNKLAIQPIQQFRYTVGKNATDSSLIIDAMDLLHSGRVDGFCLVSSDSDFTRLATRLRESGVVVYGFGEAKTPEAFVSACDKFIFTEILRRTAEPQVIPDARAVPPLEEIIRPAIEATVREDGWSPLASVGGSIGRTHPSFDSRNYGFSKLGELVRNQRFLEVSEVPASDGSRNVVLCVRLKRAPRSASANVRRAGRR
jgi:uncharacterized LabA/DUF88 family protein